MFLCIMLLSFGIVRIANAEECGGGEECSITLGAPGNTVSGFGDGALPTSLKFETFGQTFKLPEGCTVLDSFTFFVDDFETIGTTSKICRFKAYIMEWDETNEKAVSESPTEFVPLYVSANIRETNILTPSFDTFEEPAEGEPALDLELTPGQAYVAFISTVDYLETVGSPGNAGVHTHPSGPYTDGSFFLQNSENDFSQLTSSAWTQDPNGDEIPEFAGYDLAFDMTFSSSGPPEPAVQLGALVDLVVGLNLQQGIANSLDAKLDSALNALDDINENNDIAAINSLQAFINAVEAQRGNKITTEQADELIAAAQAIIDCLSI